MEEQNNSPEFNVNNTATQKTVRLKPMVKQPVINIGQPTKVASVSTNSQPMATSIIEEKVAINTTRPNPLPTTATVPVRKISLTPKTAASSLGGSINRPSSILESLNIKQNVAQAEVIESAPVNPAPQMDTHTATIPKVRPINSPLSGLRPNVASSMAPTQRIQPKSMNDTSTGKVTKSVTEPTSSVSDEPSEDATVKLQRPERKVNNEARSIVPPILKKNPVEEPASAEPVSSVASAPVLPKLNTATPPVTPVVSPSAAPTVKLSLNKNAETPKAEATAAATPAAEEAKPKLGLKKKEEKKVEAPVEEKAEDKKATANEPKVKILKKDEPNPTASKAYLAVILITFALVSVASLFAIVQYVNICKPAFLEGKTIELSILKDIGKL